MFTTRALFKAASHPRIPVLPKRPTVGPYANFVVEFIKKKGKRATSPDGHKLSTEEVRESFTATSAEVKAAWDALSELDKESYAMEESKKASATTAFKEARKAWKASLSDEMVTRIKQEGTAEHPSAIQIKRYNALKGVAKLNRAKKETSEWDLFLKEFRNNWKGDSLKGNGRNSFEENSKVMKAASEAYRKKKSSDQ